ncbi:MAG TPA: hypothetical protein PL009_02425 [Flavipsychrobacter sp.]|nr:hypothetical protein [Flavipsychrobacter sp.]
MKIRKPTWSKRPTFFKRLNAPYRVVFIDDETLEEVGSFNLTKGRMYVLFSTLFVTTVTITVMILLFTPLKYYIPGYGNNRAHREVVRLRKDVDSLRDMIGAQQQMVTDIRKVIVGEIDVVRDTKLLDMDRVHREAMNSILPPGAVIKEDAVGKETKKKRR